MGQEYGLLGEKIKAKVFENQGKVSFAFGIAPIIDQLKDEQPIPKNWEQISDLTAMERKFCKWYEKWLGEAV